MTLAVDSMVGAYRNTGSNRGGGDGAGVSGWMADGKAIAFIAPDERGHIGIYTQAFDPLRNLPESRRGLDGFDRDDPTESFGIARDGSAMTVSVVDQAGQRGAACQAAGTQAASLPEHGQPARA
jgi:hypothetical protein